MDVSKLYKYSLFLVFSLLISRHSLVEAQPHNVLLGHWIVDDIKTIDELTSSNLVKDKAKWTICYEKALCGNYVIKFESKKYYYLYPVENNAQYIQSEGEDYLHSKTGRTIKIHHEINGENIEFEIELIESGFRIYLDGFYEYYKPIRIENGIEVKLLDDLVPNNS